MKKYQIILADPPWEYKKSGGIKSSRGLAKKSYPIMKLEDIKNLPIQKICSKNCYLFLWVTAPRIPEGLEVMKAWGFEYFTIAFTWIKTYKKSGKLFWGMGTTTRANPEFVLLGKKGKLRRTFKNIHSVVISPIQEHSQKPEEIRSRIDKLYDEIGYRNIELFARRKPPVWVDWWDVWGNEVESDIEL